MDVAPQPIGNGATLSIKEQNDRRWEDFKYLVGTFYLELGESLKSTIHMIEDIFNFQASERKWKMKIREWGFKKYRKVVDAPSGKRKHEEDTSTSLTQDMVTFKDELQLYRKTFRLRAKVEQLLLIHKYPAEQPNDKPIPEQSETQPKTRSTPQWRNGNASLERYVNSTTHSVSEGLMLRAQTYHEGVTTGHHQQTRQIVTDWNPPPISRLQEPHTPLSREVLSSLNYPHEVPKGASQHTKSHSVDNMTETSSNRYGLTYSVSDITGVSYSAIMVP